MPGFAKDSFRTPIAPNVFLRSTQDVKTTSYTVAKGSIDAETIDGVAGQKILQKGELMCRITSGADTGKIGPFRAGATDGRQTIGNAVGFNNTYLPWQLVERDVEVAVVYEATVYAAAVTERNSSGVRIALQSGTITSLIAVSALYKFLFV